MMLNVKNGVGCFNMNYHSFSSSKHEGIVKGEFLYSSSIDNISNLYAHYAYNDRGAKLPIVILMHGYVQDASAMTPWIMCDMARFGFFACAVGMRGRDGADGSVDVSGRELYDIIDAIEYIKHNFADIVDANNINVVGYSGGGGNVFGLAAKFPDYFNLLVSHFGISDYGYDPINSWWATNPNRRPSMKNWIGHTPDENIGAYYCRAHHLGVGKNFMGGFLYIFHDTGDDNVPVIQSKVVANEMDKNNLNNYYLSITTPDDSVRWIHANPHENEPIRLSREVWGMPVLNKIHKNWCVPKQCQMLVQGYLVTKRFEIWLGNGQEHVANVDYDTQMKTYNIKPLTGSVLVTIKQENNKATQIIDKETLIKL